MSNKTGIVRNASLYATNVKVDMIPDPVYRAPMMENTAVPYKFNEAALLSELKAYIDGTYKKHYVGNDNIQAFELIVSAGHGTGFAIGDVIKYAARYGKKNGHNRDDLLKILHYTILALYVHDKEKA
jgi:hypothetical protein